MKSLFLAISWFLHGKYSAFFFSLDVGVYNVVVDELLTFPCLDIKCKFNGSVFRQFSSVITHPGFYNAMIDHLI